MMPVIELNGCLFHVQAILTDYVFVCKRDPHMYRQLDYTSMIKDLKSINRFW